MNYQPEVYQFFEQNQRFSNNYRIKVSLKNQIVHAALDEAVQEGIKRYPYFAVQLSLDDNEGYLFERNDRPIAVLACDGTPPALGSKEAGGHFLLVDHQERAVFFEIDHALAGASGLLNFVKTVLYLYLCKTEGITLDPTGIWLPSDPLLPGERAYPTLETLPNEVAFPKRKRKTDLMFMEDRIKASQGVAGYGSYYYSVEIGQQGLMQYCKSHDGTPNASLFVLLYKFLDRSTPVEKGDIICALAANYKKSVGCPNTTQDLVKSIPVVFPRGLAEESPEKLGTMARGQIILGSDSKNMIEAARDMLTNNEKVDALQTFQEKKAYAGMHNRFTDPGSTTTFALSYAGQCDWGSLAPYITAVNTITLSNLMMEVNSVGDRFYVTFQQCVEDRRYLDGFLQELEHAGISYQVTGPFEKHLPALLLPENVMA
jgi:hypothetical protein